MKMHNNWNCLPDHLLLSIFRYLRPRAVLDASLVCSQWHRVALDDILWRDLFYQDFRISRSIPAAPGSLSWLSEYKRLSFHTPAVESEVIQEHQDEVWHVSFAHNGELFATASKDGFIKVWSAAYPCRLKHEADMKAYEWENTRFSQFNSNDTLLLVSGEQSDPQGTSGEIAVFSLDDDFKLRFCVTNEPFDILGAWYNNNYLISGNLIWSGNAESFSVLCLNKALQALESKRESVGASLYKFRNNYNYIRTILVARCQVNTSEEIDQRRSYHSNMSDSQSDSKSNSLQNNSGGDGGRNCQPLTDALSVECTESHTGASDFKTSNNQPNVLVLDTTSTVDEALHFAEDCHLSSAGAAQTQSADDEFCDKYLIFTMGDKTNKPHQIGLKRMAATKMKDAIDLLKHRELQLVPNNDEEPDIDVIDVDHSIELHSQIIGMCLSPDHRFLYVNSRAWPTGYQIADPHSPPSIAEEIDMHVIDLVTLTEVGSPLRSHKAYTSNEDCFYIYLDVSSQYIASGSEDHHGYLWDRHYEICLQKFKHLDSVIGAAFNLQDPEVLVTVSDDNSIKIWRSRNREIEVKRSISSQNLE